MKKYLLTTTILLTPAIASAQPDTFAGLVNLFIELINQIFYLIIGLILLVFLYGLAKFIFSLGSSDDVEDGKRLMFWGVVALFLAVSFWGIVEILRNTILLA